MAIPTVANVEAVLVSRRGQAIIASGLSATPAADASPRSYLGPAIAHAVREQGVAVASPTAPADGEVALAADEDRLYDLADLFLVEKLLSDFIQVDWSTNTQKQWLDQYRSGLQKIHADCLARCERLYGYGLGAPAAFALDLAFTARDATAPGPFY